MGNKKLSMLLAVLLVIPLLMAYPMPVSATGDVWDASVASAFDGGDGTEGSPYEIATAEQLALLQQLANASDPIAAGHFKLTADIYLNNVDGVDVNTWATTPPANKWTGIAWGGATILFNGVLDGNGHVIRGLYVSTTNTGGFIGRLGGTVKNLGIEDSYIYGSSSNMGAFAGAMQSATALISNCYSTAVVVGGQATGGIAGRINFDLGRIIGCYNAGTVTGSSNYVGGIVGISKFTGSVVSECYNIGTVTSTVAAPLHLGGILGANEGQTSNCYNWGSVGTAAAKAVGGISGTGTSGSIQNSYNAGVLIGASEVGGICGRNTAATFTNTYYDSTVNSAIPGIGSGTGTATGLSSAQMKSASALSTMNLDDTIWFAADGSYPIFKKDSLNNDLEIAYPAGVTAGTAVWLNGVDVTSDTDFGSGSFVLPVSGATTGSTVQLSDGVNNYVYFITNNDGVYTATLMTDLKNLLGYVGFAIRTNAVLGQGLRFKSSIPNAVKNDGYAGFTVVEYGTLAKKSANPADLTYIAGASENSIGKGMAYDTLSDTDIVYAVAGQTVQFTSVLIGITSANYHTEYSFRSYCVFSDGTNSYVVYGEEVNKSIYDVATVVLADLENGLSGDSLAYVQSIVNN